MAKNAIVRLDEGELLYKIIRQRGRMPDGTFHKIISKRMVNGQIEVASIFESDEEKDYRIFTCTMENADDIFAEIISIAQKVAPGQLEYTIIDFSRCTTEDEQARMMKTMPDTFTEWDNTGDHPRKIRIDNAFRLDNVENEGYRISFDHEHEDKE